MTDYEAGKLATEIVRQDTRNLLEESGVSFALLAKQLKDELKAKEVKFLKVKRNQPVEQVIDQIKTNLGKGAKITGYKVITETLEEMVIAVTVRAWDVQQRARMDAHKLRGDYPSEKHEHTGKDGAPLVPPNLAPRLIRIELIRPGDLKDAD